MKYIPIIVTGLLTAISMMWAMVLELNGHAVTDQIIITVFLGLLTVFIIASGDY